MATKPTVADVRWATDVSNNTAPSSGQRDTGWTPNQVAVSDYFNVLFLEAYKWALYLSDGALTGNHTITGTLGVTGAVDLDTSLNVDGPIHADGAIDTDSTLTVDGVSTLTGEIKHGSREFVIPALTGMTDDVGTPWVVTSNTGSAAGACWTGGANARLVIPIPLLIGDRILAVRIYVQDTTGGETLTASLCLGPASGGTQTVVASVTSAGNGTAQALLLGSLTSTLSGTNYFYVLVQQDSGTTTTHKVTQISVTYDRP